MSTNRPQHVDQNWQPEDHQPADPVRDAAPELLAALKLAAEALEHSAPQQSHYPEPKARHATALAAALLAIAKATGGK